MDRLIEIGPRVPRRGSRVLAWIGRRMLRLTGWRISGEFPDVPRAVVIMAPHTSNWDGFFALMMVWALRLDVHFMAKHTLFRWPFGPLVRAMGGIPVRPGSAGVVDQSVQRLQDSSGLLLAISPEGRRDRAERFRSGFHRIARQARVPVVVVTFDYEHKLARVEDCFHPGDHLDADMELVLERVHRATPRRPERLSEPIRRRRERAGESERE